MPFHTKSEQAKNRKSGPKHVKRILRGIAVPIPGSSNDLLQKTINPLDKVLKQMRARMKKK